MGGQSTEPALSLNPFSDRNVLGTREGSEKGSDGERGGERFAGRRSERFTESLSKVSIETLTCQFVICIVEIYSRV